MHQHGHDDPKAAKLYAMIKDMKIAMMTTIDTEVNLAYADPSSQHYVSIFGTAEIVRDKAKIREKWSAGLQAWFPNGVDDPQIALIRVHPVKGEYWDGPNSTVLHLYGAVKAAV